MVSGLEPKILVCVECGQEFVFTINAQEYFAEKGYTEEPKRCKHCHMQHKRDKRTGPADINKLDFGTLYPD
jgi:DNA-directed RNA polymerase subunit RPC12/RpoP